MVDQRTRSGRFLLGFMDEQEAFDILKGRCIFEETSDEDLRNIWRDSKAAVDALPNPDLKPEIVEIDSKFREHLDAVSKKPLFSEVTRQGKWRLKSVEIDKLVCFQKHVDTDYSEDVVEERDLGNAGELIEFCLPLKPRKRMIARTFDPEQQVHTLFSPNVDLRILGSTQGEDPVTKRKLFGFAVGWGVPFIQVVKFNKRYFLKNGYHRVYALRKNGITHVPCILIQGNSYADTGAAKVGFFPQELLMSRKPPTFANILSDDIAPEVNVRPLTKFVRVKAEQFVLPVAPTVLEPKEGEGVPPPPTEVGPQIEDMGYEDFKIEREDWNIYKLSDGAILKLRQVLLKVRMAQGVDPSQQSLSFESSPLLMAVLAPSDMMGTPSTGQYGQEELSESIVERDVTYETIQETSNEYVTEGGMRVVLQLASPAIAKTDKFDASGVPIYIVNVQTNIQVLKPAQAE